MAQVAGERRRLTSGVLAASLTPMMSDGAAHLDLLAEHCRSLLDLGCSSIVLLGTTGEANSFTILERRTILEGLLNRGIGADRLVVGTGCCAVGDTVSLTKHALARGVHRVLMLPPFYYKPASDDGLFAAFAQTIEAIADDRLRIYLYLIPQLSGVALSPDLVGRLVEAYPLQIAGLKDSSGNWQQTQVLCERFGERIDVLPGSEAFLLRGLAAGASGCISATANVNAKRIVELYKSREAQHASELQTSVNAVRAEFEKYPVIPALKAYLASHSGDSTWSNVRAPLVPLDSAERAHLDSALAKL